MTVVILRELVQKLATVEAQVDAVAGRAVAVRRDRAHRRLLRGDGLVGVRSRPERSAPRADEALEAVAGSGFENPQPLWNDAWDSLTGFLDISPSASPGAYAMPVVRGDEARFATPPGLGAAHHLVSGTRPR